MKTQTLLLRKTALAAAVALVIGGFASLDYPVGTEIGMSSFISSAYAGDGSSGGGHKGAMGENRGGQGGQGAQGAGGQGNRGGRSVADVLADDDGDDDSDRPDWAGVTGGEDRPGGGGNIEPGTPKGDEYGDLFVILRNDDGSPVTEGNEVYILLSDGTVVLTEGGEVPAGTDATLLQSVEFGRMNIARSPASVIEHALTEALSKLDKLEITGDNIDDFTDESGRLTVDGLTIDSPLESLALYQALVDADAKEVNEDGMLVISATSSHDGADTTYTLLVDPAILWIWRHPHLPPVRTRPAL